SRGSAEFTLGPGVPNRRRQPAPVHGQFRHWYESADRRHGPGGIPHGPAVATVPAHQSERESTMGRQNPALASIQAPSHRVRVPYHGISLVVRLAVEQPTGTFPPWRPLPAGKLAKLPHHGDMR